MNLCLQKGDYLVSDWPDNPVDLLYIALIELYDNFQLNITAGKPRRSALVHAHVSTACMLIKWRFVLRVSVSFNMAKSNSKPYYAVRKGRKTGVFTSWDQVQPLVDKFPGAQQKRFESLAQAELWVSTAVCVSPPKSTPPSSAGSNGTQSPRLDRSPRKPTWSSSQSLGLEGVRRDLPSSPTRSKPRMDNYTTKVNNEKMEVATRATNLENPTNLTGKEETTWCPTTSEIEMTIFGLSMVQSDLWNKVEQSGAICTHIV